MKNLNNNSLKHQGTTITLFFSSIKSISKIKEYKETSNVLIEAVKNEKHVKIEAMNNESHRLKKIGIENGSFYGFKKIKGKLVKTFININRISKVQSSGTTLLIFYNVIW